MLIVVDCSTTRCHITITYDALAYSWLKWMDGQLPTMNNILTSSVCTCLNWNIMLVIHRPLLLLLLKWVVKEMCQAQNFWTMSGADHRVFRNQFIPQQLWRIEHGSSFLGWWAKNWFNVVQLIRRQGMSGPIYSSEQSERQVFSTSRWEGDWGW